MKKEFAVILLFTFALGLSGIFISCKENEGGVNEETVEEETAEEDIQPSVSEAEPTEAPDIEVNIVPVPNSPAIPGAKARISSLKDGDLLEDPDVSVVVDVENFELGVQTNTVRAMEIMNSAQGQHAHIILDNDPYLADYESGKPFEIGTLGEGPHTLVVFPSRSYHESVKSTEAADIINFYVGKKEGVFMLDKSKPAIIYSRPKGKYEGPDAEKVMLDFYLYNVELGPDGYKAKYTIRKKDPAGEVTSIILTEWAPAYVTGLTSGDYAVKLELLDKDGNAVPGAFNSTEREISVAR
jgi:hypothetical protein